MQDQIVEQISPEMIQSFHGMPLEGGLILLFFAYIVGSLILQHFRDKRQEKAEKSRIDAFMHALDKRDSDHRKVIETLDRMIERLSVLERKVDRISEKPEKPPPTPL